MRSTVNLTRILLLGMFVACRMAFAGEFMRVEEIGPGMKGTGRTVFQGTEVEEFGVEVLGVLRRATVKGDIILARLSGGPLERTGVIAGMSGSPVYIESRLIGAMAYRYGAFSKDPICGITPISEMLGILAEGDSRHGDYSSLAGGITIPPLEGLEPFWGGTLVPIGSPLYISGFDRRTLHYIEPFCARFSLLPVLGGEYSGQGSLESPPLEPGSCLGVQLMTGDASLAVTGTLTYIDEDRILAFGHPMYSAGPTELPMTGGWVHSVLPSQWASFKITSPTQIVGTIEEDRKAGVVGTLGQGPELLRLNIVIDGEPYDFSLVREKALAPVLTGWATLNSIVSSARILGDLTASTSLIIEMKDHPPLTLRYLASGEKTPLTVAQHIDKLLGQVLNNKFEQVALKKIGVSISLSEERRTAEIQTVALGTQRARPGDTLELFITLRSYRGKSISETVRILLPEEAPRGEYTVKVMDGPKYWNEETKRVPLRFEPGSLSELLSLIQANPEGDEIFCQLYSSSPGATIRGDELPSLPPSVVSTMKSSKQSGGESLTRLSLVAERTIETDFLVSGKEEIKFEVR